MGKQKKLPGSLVRIFDLPKELSSDDPKISVFEDTGMLIENHTEVLTYTPKFMRIATAKFILQIEGEGLELSRMDQEGVYIAGQIHRITYEKER